MRVGWPGQVVNGVSVAVVPEAINAAPHRMQRYDTAACSKIGTVAFNSSKLAILKDGAPDGVSQSSVVYEALCPDSG